MPFASREKPRLIERLRGKSGRDLLNEVKSAWDSDRRRMLFDTPSWSSRNCTFPRGFPFDDEPLQAASFVDRPFADRTTGFGDTLHEPPWDEESGSKRRVLEPEAPAKPSPLSQHGLRNTVPFTQKATSERPARAMSAPPGDRPPRYTSTCEIPVMGSTTSQQTATSQQQPSTPSQQATPNNVRLIPIQVEGRDEPLVNSDLDTSTNFAAEPPTFDARLPRDFGPFRKHSARFQNCQQQAPPQQQFQQTPKQQNKQQQQASSRPPSSEQKTSDEPDRPAPPDPTTLALSRIAEVQREVESLAKQVEQVSVTSRKEKQYVYLDEMLTRQLLLLDNIDPAGNDTVRQARKDAIKSIQKCICDLENKAPCEAMEVESSDLQAESEQPEEPKDEPMAVAEESENSVVPAEGSSDASAASADSVPPLPPPAETPV